jgi:hypothetical protein
MPEPRRPGDVGFPGRRPAARAAGGSAGRAGRGRVRRPPARTHQRGADPVRTRAAGYRGGAGLRQLPSWRRRLHRLPLSLSGAQAALTAAETGSCASTWPPRAWPPGYWHGVGARGLCRPRLCRQYLREPVPPDPGLGQQRVRALGRGPPETTNVSIEPLLWGLLGNRQPKIQPPFRQGSWDDPAVAVPRRDDGTRTALAEAVALVEGGRSQPTRRRLARVVTAEPAISSRWLRALATELRRYVMLHPRSAQSVEGGAAGAVARLTGGPGQGIPPFCLVALIA